MTKLSIIIPIYNNFHYTKALLNDIGRCVKTPDYEVIIIDNASEDETKDFFTDIDNLRNISNIKNLEYYRMDENIYVNPAWNLWVEKAKWEYVMIANNDIILTEWFDLPLIDNLKDNILVTSPIYTEWPSERNHRRHKWNKFNPLNICWHLFCLKKENWVEIPSQLKIRYWDNWIYENMVAKKWIEISCPDSKIHHYWSLTVKEVNPIIRHILERDKREREILKHKWL